MVFEVDGNERLAANAIPTVPLSSNHLYRDVQSAMNVTVILYGHKNTKLSDLVMCDIAFPFAAFSGTAGELSSGSLI